MSVKMIRFDAFDITGGIHQAIGRVRGDGHNATEIVHKKAIGAPLLPGSHPALRVARATLRSPSMSWMKSGIWLGLYRWESTWRTTSPT